MDIDILSLFPDYFTGPFDESILKRARQKSILNIHHINLRDFTEDKHHRVDDRPFGGGPGMVLMAPPVQKAIRSVRRPTSTVIYLTPQGKPLNAEKCERLAQKDHLILLCGHYEGIDERVIEHEVDEEISIGDYVLTNGGLPAIVLIDAVARFIPGVLGHQGAAAEDSFQGGILDCSHYTRPEVFEGRSVPTVLLQGNHKEIAKWRKEDALKRTLEKRPDLYYARIGGIGESQEGKFGITLPAWDLKSSLKFYHKVLGLEILKQSEISGTFQIGKSYVTFVKGISQGNMGFNLVLEKQPFERVVERLRREAVENLQTKAEEATFQDLNGYYWVLLKASSFKGE